jgi:hypothetical protein
VTSTLVMDALYSGCRQVEEAARFLQEVRGRAAGERWSKTGPMSVVVTRQGDAGSRS